MKHKNYHSTISDIENQIMASMMKRGYMKLERVLGNDKNILIITAHPDDSVIMLGGFIQEAIAITGSEHVFVLVATDGEGGENRLPPGNEDFVKNGGRINEERACLAFLGIREGAVSFAHLPDGALSQTKYRQILSQQIAELMQRHAIGLLVTLGPENDGHPDHAATHNVAAEVAKGVAVLSLNGHHEGEVVVQLGHDQTDRKFKAAQLHASQYTTPDWLQKRGETYTMGPRFKQMSPFYPPLVERETFDLKA